MGRFGLVGVVGWSLTLVCGGWAAGQQAPIETSILNVDFGDVELRVAGDVFSDVRLRMMLLHAVDWRSLPGAQAVWFGDERVDHLATPYDPYHASLLWAAGQPNGFSIEIWSDRDALVVAEGLRSYLVAIGVSAEVRAASDDQLRQRLAELARTGGRGIVVLSAQSSASATVPRPVAPDVRADDRVSVEALPMRLEVAPLEARIELEYRVEVTPAESSASRVDFGAVELTDGRRPVEFPAVSAWPRSQPVEFALYGRLWDDPLLRTMVLHAVDWRQMGGHPVVFTYGGEVLSTAGIAHDPQRARQLLQEAREGHGLWVSLVAVEGGANIGHAVRSALERVDVSGGEVDVVSEGVLRSRLMAMGRRDLAFIVVRPAAGVVGTEPAYRAVEPRFEARIEPIEMQAEFRFEFTPAPGIVCDPNAPFSKLHAGVPNLVLEAATYRVVAYVAQRFADWGSELTPVGIRQLEGAAAQFVRCSFPALLLEELVLTGIFDVSEVTDLVSEANHAVSPLTEETASELVDFALRSELRVPGLLAYYIDAMIDHSLAPGLCGSGTQDPVFVTEASPGSHGHVVAVERRLRAGAVPTGSLRPGNVINNILGTAAESSDGCAVGGARMQAQQLLEEQGITLSQDPEVGWISADAQMSGSQRTSEDARRAGWFWRGVSVVCAMATPVAATSTVVSGPVGVGAAVVLAGLVVIANGLASDEFAEARDLPTRYDHALKLAMDVGEASEQLRACREWDATRCKTYEEEYEAAKEEYVAFCSKRANRKNPACGPESIGEEERPACPPVDFSCYSDEPPGIESLCGSMSDTAACIDLLISGGLVDPSPEHSYPLVACTMFGACEELVDPTPWGIDPLPPLLQDFGGACVPREAFIDGAIGPVRPEILAGLDQILADTAPGGFHTSAHVVEATSSWAMELEAAGLCDGPLFSDDDCGLGSAFIVADVKMRLYGPLDAACLTELHTTPFELEVMRPPHVSGLLADVRSGPATMPALPVDVHVVGDMYRDQRMRLALMHGVDWKARPLLHALRFDSGDVGVTDLTFDPDRARQLHAEAGWPTGYGLTLFATPETADFAGIVIAELEMIGVAAEFTVVDKSEVRGRMETVARTGGRAIAVLQR